MHGLKSGGGGANWDVYCKFNVQMSIHCFGVLDTKTLQNLQATELLMTRPAVGTQDINLLWLH